MVFIFFNCFNYIYHEKSATKNVHQKIYLTRLFCDERSGKLYLDIIWVYTNSIINTYWII